VTAALFRWHFSLPLRLIILIYQLLIIGYKLLYYLINLIIISLNHINESDNLLMSITPVHKSNIHISVLLIFYLHVYLNSIVY